jgi:hypothetical protein
MACESDGQMVSTMENLIVSPLDERVGIMAGLSVPIEAQGERERISLGSQILHSDFPRSLGLSRVNDG